MWPALDDQGRALAEELRAVVRGEVRFDDGSRALYAADASNYRQVPIGVVIPRDAADVVETVAACRKRGVPLLGRGGGTSLAGQCCNAAVVIDFSKHMRAVLELDPERKLARVEPGLVLDDLQRAAEPHGLFFPPDPSTHAWCTLGGMIGNNSCGVHSIVGGRTSENVEELEVLTYDGLRLRVGRTSDADLARLCAESGRRGDIYRRLKALRDRIEHLLRTRVPQLPRRVSGYDLTHLLPENGFHVARALVGTESTCVTVLEATIKLTPKPGHKSLLVLGFKDVYEAADEVPHVMKFGPIGLEGLDDRLIADARKKGLHTDALKLLPQGGGWLMAEFGGKDKAEADAKARLAQARIKAVSSKLFDDPPNEKKLWEVRESGLGATAMIRGEPPTWEGWEDSAVPPERLGEYLRKLRPILDRYGYKGDFYGHFGQGCLHTRIDFDLQSHRGVREFHSFLEEASDLVVSLGGSMSGEHGDGQSKAEFLPKMYGSELVAAFREFKEIWDPRGRMNPGKMVDAYRPDENLRLGERYRPATPDTVFRYPEDEFSFPHAALRCVGVGKCRKVEGGGLMCPSYRVTKEEKHATRGRAHLLFEMLRGEVIGKSGWREDAVKDALDLCLACKGCKGECPVNVDIATYKAEFLSHYYEDRLRPRPAYAMGLIHWWARAASLAPGVANFFTQTPATARAAKALAGLAPERAIPPFAPRTFHHWLRDRGHAKPGDRVILWADTFNEHFTPEVAIAAFELLEAAGFRVEVPPAGLCCGRPLYDYGMLGLAKTLLRRTLHALRDQISDGAPMIVLEPSCASVFRDELPALFPHDEDARRLKNQTFLLGEFLEKRSPGLRLRGLDAKALVQGHCHQQALFGLDPDKKLLAQAGVNAEVLDSGCCGLAGSFGFEDGEHYDVSMACGERVLFPAVRGAPADRLLVADGFSCREQILHGTGRRARHLAQVLLDAVAGGAP